MMRKAPGLSHHLNTEMNYKDQINQLIDNHKRNACSQILKSKPELLNWLKSQVPYPYQTISELIWLYQNPNFNPICEAGNKFKFHAGKYQSGCGGNCACVLKNKIQTNIKRYGESNPAKSKKIKEKIKQSFMERFGIDNPSKLEETKEKAKQTNLKKYGVEYSFQAEETKEKIKRTIFEKYGVSHQMHADIIKEKLRQTNLKRLGVENPSQNKFIQKKKIENNIKKYGVKHPNQKHISKEQMLILEDANLFKNAISNKTIKEIQYILSIDGKTIRRYAENYGSLNLIKFDTSSRLEDKIEGLCTEYQIPFLRNTRKIISPLELDFYFPKSNTAIECHGLFWHSELGGEKQRDYHYNKWKYCKERGVDLYQYFEDEIESNFHIIKSKILYLNHLHSIKPIGARNLHVAFLKNFNDETDFYHTNHIQGNRLDRTHVIGAWLDSFTLSACMSIKKIKNDQIEIIRFATDIKNRYPGVFSKILAWYIAQTNFKGEIISWSDNRHSNGKLYQSNGFEYVRIQGPGYFVTDYQTRWRREHFMKNKIKQRYPEVDLTKTEWQLEQELGYDRVWDAGKILWKLKV
jgi:hypothetical protein